MRKALAPAFAFVVATWAVAAGAQTGTAGTAGQTGTTDQPPGVATGQTSGNPGSSTGQATASSSGDVNNKQEKGEQKFVRQAAIVNQAEIQLGRLGVQKAQDPQVKQFAQQMVDNHTKALDELKQAASAQGFDVPTQLDSRHQTIQDKLAGLSGTDFDRQFMKDTVASHKEAEHLLQKRAGKNGDRASAAGVTPGTATGTSGTDTGIAPNGATGTSGATGAGTADVGGTGTAGTGSTGMAGGAAAGTSGTGTAGTAGTTGSTTANNAARMTIDQWAATTLGHVRSHLQQAEDLQKQVKQEARDDNNKSRK